MISNIQKTVTIIACLISVSCSKIDKTFDDLDQTRKSVELSNEHMTEMIDLTRFGTSCEQAVDSHTDLANRQLKMQSCILGAPMDQTKDNNIERDWLYELIGAAGSVLKLASAPVLVPDYKDLENGAINELEFVGYRDEQHRIVTFVKGFTDEVTLPSGIGYDLFIVFYTATLNLLNKFYYQAAVLPYVSKKEQDYRRKGAIKTLYVAPTVFGAVWSQKGLLGTKAPSVVKFKGSDFYVPMQVVHSKLRNLVRSRLRKIHADYRLDDPTLANHISLADLEAYVLEPRLGDLPTQGDEPKADRLVQLTLDEPLPNIKISTN